MKLPSFQFYPGDWMKDPNLLRCSKAEKGAWIDMLCLLHECEERGVFVTNDIAWTDDEIAQAIGGDKSENLECLAGLLRKGVARRNKSGAIYSARIVRDENKRKLCSEAGKKGGGNPTFIGQSKGEDKGAYKGAPKQNTKPSTSSSISFSDSIIKYLNSVAKKDFRSGSEKTKKLIQARVNDGFTESDFKKVIDIKTKIWLNDPKMNQFLRPETLFGNKFEGYLNESPNVKTQVSNAPGGAIV
jgi:uncharacterized phage protein (TIGR02220 family)